MNFEQLTQKSSEALEIGKKMAIKLNHSQIDGEHLHYGLIAVEDSFILKLLAYMKIDLKGYRDDLISYLERQPSVEGSNEQLYASRRINKILLDAEDEAKSMSDQYISLEHIYLTLMKEKRTKM